MTFLSALATLVAVLLMIFGVNLTELTGSADLPEATAAPLATEASATPGASAQPTSAPSAQPSTGVRTEVTDGFVTRESAAEDVQTLVTAIYASAMSGSRYSAPEFVIDNADTRLCARWADYMAAKGAVAGDARIAAFGRPGVVPTVKTMYSEGERIVAEVSCALTLKTAAGDEVKSNPTLRLTYEMTGDAPTISAIDVLGDADYEALKAAVPAGADATAIDAAVDAAIAALK